MGATNRVLATTVVATHRTVRGIIVLEFRSACFIVVPLESVPSKGFANARLRERSAAFALSSRARDTTRGLESHRVDSFPDTRSDRRPQQRLRFSRFRKPPRRPCRRLSLH